MSKLVLFFSVISQIFIIEALKAQTCDLPESFPSTPMELEEQNLVIAKCFAPSIHQLAENKLINSVSGRADLITAVNYDGDWNTGNNWEALKQFELGNPSEHPALKPVVYFSVVWTDVAWLITYGFYHPRDYAGAEDCCCHGCEIKPFGDNHENDFEGAMIVVSRVDTDTGIMKNNVVGGYSISHNDLKKYPTISTLPDVYIDNRTHAVELAYGPLFSISGINPCDDSELFTTPNIFYTPSNSNHTFVEAENSSINPDFLIGEGKYKLDDIFSNSSESLWSQRNNGLVFNGDKFNSVSVPDSSDCAEYGSNASAPWGWSQFEYSNSNVQTWICESMYGDIGQTGCMDNPPLILYNPYVPVDCVVALDYVIELNEDTEYNNYTNLTFQGIVVKPGNTFTIKDCTLDFSESGYIDVRPGATLIVDNSTLTSCNSKKWQGIKARAEGSGGFTGNVIVRNNSIIKKARTGISFGLQKNFSYSSLNFSNSTLEFNDVGISFGYGYSGTYITEATFRRNAVSDIILRGTSGVNIKKSRFSQFSPDINQRSINSINSSFTIEEGCEFIDNVVGVVAAGTFPLSAGIRIGHPDLSKNLFQSSINFVGIGNTSPYGVNISNNLFSDFGIYGAYFSGENKISLLNNSFEQITNAGIRIETTGDNFNYLNCNQFDGIFKKGIYSENDNHKSVFLGNNFNEPNIESFYSGDVFLENSSLSPFIGTQTNPAGNCFSGVQKDIVESTIGTNFVYFFEGNAESCYEPFEDGGFTNFFTLQPAINCPSVGVFNLIDPDGDGDQGIDFETYDFNSACKSCLLNIIHQWIDIVVAGGSDDPREENVNNQVSFTAAAFQNEQVLDQWINYALYVALESKDYLFAEQILFPLKKWKWQTRLFGLKMLERNYIDAKNILETLPERNLNEEYFKYIQQLNLHLYTDPGNGDEVFGNSQLNHLKMIALSNYPVKGYASALYFQITGDLILPGLTQFDPRDNDFNERKNENESPIKLTISPNPALDKINLTLSKNLKMDHVLVFNFNGQIVVEKSVQQNGEIDISHLPSGLYFVKVKEKEGEFYYSK